MAFNPNSISVKKGESVVWKNEDSMAHTATADGDDPSFDTGKIAAKTSSKPITFNDAGDVPYHCEIHPGMKGTVKVS